MTDRHIILHAFKQDVELYVDALSIFCIATSNVTGSTVITANGGAMLPVKETVDEVLKLRNNKIAELSALNADFKISNNKEI